ncbi:cupin domain-containing protein [Candidatus Bathyarchaeota archaeon]|nr:cupin domain-containing protein [Candidatus Bathyarchaeota archaeon]
MAKVFNLNTLAEFSRKEGLLNKPEDLRAVKQDLLKTGSFNVALICFEAGQEIPPHPEPYGVCFYVIKGKGEFTVGSEQFELASGEMIFAQANEARGILSKERLTLLGVQDPH